MIQEREKAKSPGWLSGRQLVVLKPTMDTAENVQESNNNLVSVTQRDKSPLPIGEKVLVIAGRQARIVADYTISPPEPKPAHVMPGTTPRPSAAPAGAGTVAVVSHAGAAPSGAASQNPRPALGGTAGAQTLTAKPPLSSSAATAGGGNSRPCGCLSYWFYRLESYPSPDRVCLNRHWCVSVGRNWSGVSHAVVHQRILAAQ